MTFEQQQTKINACYKGFYNDGVFVSRSFSRSKYYDKRFFRRLWRKVLPF